MKYLIIGTGGTGGCIGANLAAAGQDVTFIARGTTLSALQNEGLTLDSDKQGLVHIHPVQACSAEEYNDIADVILVCVKYYSIPSILPILLVIHRDTDTIGWVSGGVCLPKMLSMMLSILPVEKL